MFCKASSRAKIGHFPYEEKDFYTPHLINGVKNRNIADLCRTAGYSQPRKLMRNASSATALARHNSATHPSIHRSLVVERRQGSKHRFEGGARSRPLFWATCAHRHARMSPMKLTITAAILLMAALASIAYRLTHRSPDDTGTRLRSDIISGALMYAFFAPAIGGIAVTLVLSILSQDPKNLITMIFGLPWFYLFGAIPALLCGVVAGALRPLRSSWWAMARIALIGAFFGMGFFLPFTSRDAALSDAAFPFFVGGLPGMLSAFLCAYWFYGKPGTPRVKGTTWAQTA
ncbi:hypothetical protein [Achromobacter piechaudii]|uniref:hypothetical protein n=1 Tax=Achromobacter piechaudii TaxID=72556 RepID=UPI0012E10CF1|nr:hypothetical protein [Achromobacter piechaudii]